MIKFENSVIGFFVFRVALNIIMKPGVFRFSDHGILLFWFLGSWENGNTMTSIFRRLIKAYLLTCCYAYCLPHRTSAYVYVYEYFIRQVLTCAYTCTLQVSS